MTFGFVDQRSIRLSYWRVWRGAGHYHARPPAGTIAQCHHGRVPYPQRSESPFQRRDRELAELIAELRLASPGVQLLLGFLLMAPFNGRFAETTALERGLYAVSLLSVSGAAVLLLGASVHHRVLFRRQFGERMLTTISTLALTGLSLLGIGIVAALALVAHFLFGAWAALTVSATTGGLIVWIWYLLPLHRLHGRAARRHRGD